MNNESGDTKANEPKNVNDLELARFKWSQDVPQYGDKLLRRLDEFRKNMMFYDVILKMNNGELAAHKVVLAACGGTFRTQFVDPDTKMISGEVTDVKLKCPISGIKPILNFAYTGSLELNESTLLPVLMASILTEMKEVKDICTDIAKSRISWLMTFDGTEETCSCVTMGDANNSQLRKSLDLNKALSILFSLLTLNAPNFLPSNGKLLGDKNEKKIEKESEPGNYPCLAVIQKEHPELVYVYRKMIDCLRKANVEIIPEKLAKDNLGTKGDIKILQADEDKANEKIVKPVKEELAGEKMVEKKSISSFPIKLERKLEKSDDNSKTNDSQSNNDFDISKDAKSVLKPSSMPRTVSLPPAITPPPPPTGKKVTRKQSPPQAKEIANPLSKKEPTKDTKGKLSVPESKPPMAQSPVPVKRKSAAPKPPAHPPTPNGKTPLKQAPPLPPSNARSASNRSSQKVPPPRPKPPVVKKKFLSTIDVYDDSLNPFSFDDDESQNDSTTKSDDYNTELNPFS